MPSAPEQLTLAVYEPIIVQPTCDVLLRGADTISAGRFLFAHQHVPARPATVSDDRLWLMMLDLAEDGVCIAAEQKCWVSVSGSLARGAGARPLGCLRGGPGRTAHGRSSSRGWRANLWAVRTTCRYVTAGFLVMVLANIAVVGWAIARFPAIVGGDRIVVVVLDLAILAAYGVGVRVLLRGHPAAGREATIVSVFALGVVLGLVNGADIAREYLVSLPPPWPLADIAAVLLLSLAAFLLVGVLAGNPAGGARAGPCGIRPPMRSTTRSVQRSRTRSSCHSSAPSSVPLAAWSRQGATSVD